MISKVPSTRNKHNMLYIPQNTLFCPTTGLQAISNESQTSSIWLVRVPSKPILHENGYHMHFLARNNLKFKFHNKETHNCNITTSAANHRVRYGVRSELCLTLKHNRGVREGNKICLSVCACFLFLAPNHISAAHSPTR